MGGLKWCRTAARELRDSTSGCPWDLLLGLLAVLAVISLSRYNMGLSLRLSHLAPDPMCAFGEGRKPHLLLLCEESDTGDLRTSGEREHPSAPFADGLWWWQGSSAALSCLYWAVLTPRASSTGCPKGTFLQPLHFPARNSPSPTVPLWEDLNKSSRQTSRHDLRSNSLFNTAKTHYLMWRCWSTITLR